MNTDLQTRIAAIKAECERVIELDKLASVAPWESLQLRRAIVSGDCAEVMSDGMTSRVDYDFIAQSRNVSPAMARVVLGSIQYAEMECDNFLLRCIANQWEGK